MKGKSSDTNNELEVVLDTVLDGLITIDDKGKIFSFNRAAVEIFGYGSDEVIGKNVKMLMPDPFHTEHDQYIENFLETGNKKIIGIGREVRAQRKNGTTFPMELGVNEMSVDGKRMFVGTIRDITERKEAQEKIRSETEHLKGVLDTVLDGVMTIDRKGNIQSFNPAACKIFGYQPDEVMDQNVKMLMPEPYHSEHDSYLSNYTETGQKKIIGIGREVEAQRKNGEVFSIELGVSEMPGGKDVMYVGTIKDISYRKQAEEKLLQSEERYNVAVEGAAVGLWDRNLLTDDTYYSPRYKSILGFQGSRQSEFIDEYHSFQSRIHPEDLEKHHQMLESHLNNNTPYDIDVRLQHLDGHYIWAHLKGLVLRNFAGIPTRMAGSMDDVTRKKQAEEELISSNKELERFAYMASHDLQEPLRMVASFTDLLRRRYGQKLDERAQGYIEFACSSARRMQALVTDLLEYAKVGSEAESITDIDLNITLDEVLTNLSESIVSSKAQITIQSLPTVRANPVQVHSLFQNLIGNAIKYKKSGVSPIIGISVTKAHEKWQFCVTDNGIGMKQEYCEKIFEPFKRLHGKNEFSGTGMGLAICRRFVEDMGGKIWAESNLNQGSKILFNLPSK